MLALPFSSQPEEYLCPHDANGIKKRNGNHPLRGIWIEWRKQLILARMYIPTWVGNEVQRRQRLVPVEIERSLCRLPMTRCRVEERERRGG